LRFAPSNPHYLVDLGLLETYSSLNFVTS
jgi:hypothetical protein